LDVSEYAVRCAIDEIRWAPVDGTGCPDPAGAGESVRLASPDPDPVGAHDDLVGGAELDPAAKHRTRVMRPWLLLLALPAFAAIWGGWAGLGQLAGVWLSGAGGARARQFARISALSSLGLGATGQIAYPDGGGRLDNGALVDHRTGCHGAGRRAGNGSRARAPHFSQQPIGDLKP
jgi:hypothetical protein